MVIAKTDILAGSLIEAAKIDDRVIVSSKAIPRDAMVDGYEAVGRTARYGIKKGELVCQHHLLPRPILPSNEQQRRLEADTKAAWIKLGQK